jgi:hypothetical protein
MALDPLTAALDVGGKLLDKFFPDADADMKNKMNQFLTVFTAQAQIVQAEAASGNWLASSWRPITMLTFVGLIVARWFGWAAPNLAEAEYLKLWDIVQLGLGGYVIGRSVEKIIPSIASAIKK